MSVKKIFRIFRNHFGFPRVINWGYSLFLSALGLLAVYLFKTIAVSKGYPISPTSLVGFTLLELLLVAVSMLIPVGTLVTGRKGEKNGIVDSIGSFTGIGPLLLSLLSGIGLMFIRTPIHNFFSWAWLRIGRTLIFPAFFFVNDSSSVIEKILGYISGTVVPAFGISLFFTGLMWACFKKKDNKIATIVIALSLAFFSLNFIDFIGILFTGFWLCFLRDRVGNVWGPFASLLGCGLTTMFFGKYVKEIDITMIQVYSDIDSTYFYSSLPALLVGLILIGFFAKTLNDFKASYETDSTINGEDNDTKPSLASGVNFALICAIIIIVVLWILVVKG